MQKFFTLFFVFGFFVNCLYCHALDNDDGDPTDLGCVVPIERDCDSNPLTNECGDRPCVEFGDRCGRWAAYHSDWYLWARYLQQGEITDTFDDTTYGPDKHCGTIYSCTCKWGLAGLGCTSKQFLDPIDIMYDTIHFDVNGLCAAGSPQPPTGGGPPGGIGQRQ